MESQFNIARSLQNRHAAAWASWRTLPRPQRLRLAAMFGYVAVLAVFFFRPLASLVLHASQNSLNSHVVLVPFISAYLLLSRRARPAPDYSSSVMGTCIAGGGGVAALGALNVLQDSLTATDYLSLMTASFVSFVVAGGFLFLGSRRMALAAFPFAFLVFMIPVPDAAADWLERVSVVGSSYAAGLLFTITGTPVLRDANILALPGVVLSVAQECSGIRSSVVLFITSVLASHLLLESGWRRVLLSLVVIPLAIVRNGFRILVIGLLCVHIGPHMIDSPIHHRGGPLFFAISLIPLFLVTIWLRRQERRRAAQHAP